ncbi:MAG: hypothetical protein ACYTDU_12115 [Planctomycetota bacterium]|jgi:hypothetical protein
MKRTFLLPLLLSVALSACSSDDIAALDPDLLQIAQCTGLSLEELNTVFEEVLGFVGNIGGTLPGNVTYDEMTGDYTIDSIAGPITGVVSSADDISDGLDENEAAATWDLNGGLASVGVTGTGAFDMSRPGPDLIQVTGSGSLVDQDCMFNLTSFNVSLDLSSEGGPIGDLVFDAMITDGVLNGVMDFDGSDIAGVNGDFNGASVSFRIDLNTFLPF